MNPALHSRQQPTLVYRPLMPEFDHCDALKSGSFAGLAASFERLEQQLDRRGRSCLYPLEPLVARHLSANPADVAQLCASTRCDLSAHWNGEPRSIDPLCDSSRFDAAFDVAGQTGAGNLTASWLIAVARAATGRNELTFRTLQARTAPDVRNCSVVYPNAKQSLPRVQSICERLASVSATHCMASVVWCMAAFLNAHPLPDGNGRVARLLFASGMQRAGFACGPWLAVGPLVYASNGAFEIAMRRAEIQSRWQPLIDLMAIYTDTLAELVARLEISRNPT